MKKYPRRARNHRIVYCLSKSTTLLLSPLILRLPTTAKLNLVSLYLMKLDCAYSLISGLHVQLCLFFHICFYNVLLWTEHNNYELRCPPVRQSVHFRLYLNLYIFASHDILPSRFVFSLRVHPRISAVTQKNTCNTLLGLFFIFRNVQSTLFNMFN